MIYDYVINKPSLDDALEHYGVKGMKWKKHKKKKDIDIEEIKKESIGRSGSESGTHRYPLIALPDYRSTKSNTGFPRVKPKTRTHRKNKKTGQLIKVRYKGKTMKIGY